jgi:LysR family transcriptional regulator of gallate degradation
MLQGREALDWPAQCAVRAAFFDTRRVMNLRQLEYFLAVAKARSLTLAAAELGVAQPTLTKSIRALESELGVKLFLRQPRGVELTSYGVSLQRHAQTLSVQLRDAIREMRSLQDGMSGEVTIGAGPAWLRRLLPLAVARTVERNPAIRVRVDGGFDDVLLRALGRGEVDFVVAEVPSPESAKDFKVIPLTSDRLGIACRAGHPLTRMKRVTLRRLLDYPWSMPPLSTRTTRRLRALFIAADLGPPEITVVTESMAFLVQTVLNSDAITLTVESTLGMPEAEGLRLVTVAGLEPSRVAGVVLRKDGFLSPAAEAIVEELKRICALEPTN